MGSSAGCNSDDGCDYVLLGGISSKSVTAVVGTVLGVGISGILAILFGKWTHISGYNVADIEQLTYVGQTTKYLKLENCCMRAF